MILSTEELLQCAVRFSAEQRLRSQGISIDVYFDTADLQNAITGVYAFWSPGGIVDKAKLLSAHALAWTLYAAGRGGVIRLFTPHQAELLNKLQAGFNLRFTAADEETHRRDFGLLAQTMSRSADNGVVAGELVFKIHEATRTSWRRRLTDLVQKNLLDLSVSEVNYEQVVLQPEFRAMYDVFARPPREHLSANNFSDAAALYTFVHDVRAWKQNNELPLPQFYSSSPRFREAIVAAKLGDEMRVGVGSGPDMYELDLLLEPEHIIFRALREFARVGHPLHTPLAALEQALSEGRLAVQERVLQLNGQMIDALREALELLLIEAAKEHASPDDRRALAIHREVHQIAKELQARTLTFRSLRDIWIKADNALTTRNFNVAWNSHLDANHNPLFVGGLIRFSFPNKFQVALEKIIRAVVRRDPAVVNELARGIVAASSLRVREIVPIAAALWLLELDEQLEMFLSVVRMDHFSLLILKGAAIYRDRKAKGDQALRESRDALNAVIKLLNEEYEKVRHGTDRLAAVRRSQIGIGLAYLEFRMALVDGFIPSWDRLELEKSAPSPCLDRAITLASNAAAEHRLPEPLRAYAANNYLYYLVADGNASQLTFQAAVPLLTKVPRRRDVWQARFDDTLARYFFLRSQKVKKTPQEREYLRWAFDASERALRVEPQDEEIIDFNYTVKAACDRTGGPFVAPPPDSIDVSTPLA